MKKIIRGDYMKIKITLLLVLIIAFGTSLLTYGDTTPQIYLNDTQVNIKARLGKAYINEKGITMVPLEGFMQYFGGQINEVSGTDQIKITKGAYTMVFTPSMASYERNGFNIPLGEKSIVHNDYMYVPLRRLMESLGRQVKWNHELSSIQIVSSNEEIARLNETLKNIETLEWGAQYKDNKVEFSFSEDLEVDYFKLYKLDDSWKPLPISGIVFPKTSSHYRSGYVDVTEYKGKPVLYYQVKAVIEGVESEYSKHIEVYIK